MRKGTLTDKETLRLYERGTSILVLCVHEGMTPYGVISRLGRARKARGLYVVGRRRRPQVTFTSMEALAASLDELTAATRKLHRAVS